MHGISSNCTKIAAETVQQIMAEYKILAGKTYTKRHNQIDGI